MTNLQAVARIAAAGEAEVLWNEPMSRHTSFKIGGNADLMITPENDESLREIVLGCRENEVPLHVIGNGSNILVPDEGVRGLVIRLTRLNGITVEGETLTCEAGVPLSSACSAALKNGLAGLEFAYGIPGTVGGAAYMNAGAYGGEMKDVVRSAAHLENGKFRTLDARELQFGYRSSVYSRTGNIITSVFFGLRRGDREEIEAKMAGLLQRRKEKQPLEYPSAGSVFKRPAGNFAGTLIDRCGLKGTRVGGAMVSEKHAGFIINTGSATCSDVLGLINIVKERVLNQTGVLLECEIRLIR